MAYNPAPSSPPRTASGRGCRAHKSAARARNARTDPLLDAPWILGVTPAAAWLRPDRTADRILWSPQASLLLGAPSLPVPSSLSAFFALIHPDDSSRPELQRAFEDPLPGGAGVEFRCRDAAGAERWLRLVGVEEWSGTEGPAHGHATAARAAGVRGLLMDITVAKNESLRAREDARHKTEFLGRMSHDMRTPLHAIIGLGEVLRSGNSDDPGVLVDRIIEAAEGLLGLVNDLLDIEQLRGGGQPTEVRPVDLRRVIWDCAALHRQTQRLSPVAIRCQIDPQVPRYVASDAKRLSRVLNNLVENALKFTREGHVTISCTAEAKREHVIDVLLRVSDTGPGIDAEEIKQIFNPFFRGKNEEVRPRGQGLGLSIVRDLVAQLGGTVSVTSKLGQGSSFAISLPLLEVHKPLGEGSRPGSSEQGQREVESLATGSLAGCPLTAPGPEGNVPAGRVIAGASAFLVGRAGLRSERTRILVADDSPINRQIVSAFLQHTGAQIEFAEDGGEALAVYRLLLPHLVIMDLRMPNMSGADATRAIRKYEREEGLPHCPIIAVSASALREDVASAHDAGCDEHFSKPIRRAALLAAVDKHLGAGPASDRHFLGSGLSEASRNI